MPITYKIRCLELGDGCRKSKSASELMREGGVEGGFRVLPDTGGIRAAQTTH